MSIWQAAVAAVDSERLVADAMQRDGRWLYLEGAEPVDLAAIRRIAVVGGGKAGAGMAAAVERILGPALLAEKQVAGWVNVPDDCVRTLDCIRLHGARPAGLNEPTPAGALGTDEILRLVADLGPADLCLALVSGGASALLPAPVEGVSLADKLALTRHLSAAGANIAELNTVRKQLSRIKGGGLARACRAGRLVTLIVSDVPGDPLDLIGSGPTTSDTSSPGEALEILDRYDVRSAGLAPAAFQYLTSRQAGSWVRPPVDRARVTNLIIGNNATAVDAAGAAAERLGYEHALTSATQLEGPAEEVGRDLARMALVMQHRPGPNCLVSGGEPTVRLAPPEIRGRGGRNQQLALAALLEWLETGVRGAALASGGTDGEDGPTDAAGAVIDDGLLAAVRGAGLDPRDYLRRNDAYRLFDALGGLLRTGPTHTNVCDIRVLLVDRS